MKVEALHCTPFRIPFRHPFATAHGTLTHREGVILQLEMDNGIVGLGEASPLPGSSGNALNDVPALLEAARTFLLGKSLDEVPLFPHAPSHDPSALAAVRCALDVAACDVMAQAQGMTVAELLAGHAARSVAVNATIGAATTAGAGHAAAAARSAGFRCVKLKVGMADSVAEERERVAAVREAIGPTLRLRLDANGAWEAAQAIATIQALETYGLELIEQPVSPGNLAGMKRVQDAVHIPIAADEDVTDYNAACRVLQMRAAQVLVLKPMVVGGLRPARRIIELAQAAGVAVVVTTSLDTGVGTAAALHLAATLLSENLAYGLATTELLVSDLLVHPLIVTGGRMALPDRPGLGVTVNETTLGQYTISYKSSQNPTPGCPPVRA